MYATKASTARPPDPIETHFQRVSSASIFFDKLTEAVNCAFNSVESCLNSLTSCFCAIKSRLSCSVSFKAFSDPCRDVTSPLLISLKPRFNSSNPCFDSASPVDRSFKIPSKVSCWALVRPSAAIGPQANQADNNNGNHSERHEQARPEAAHVTPRP